MSGEGLLPIKKYVVKGIASGIGLASESISAYKARKNTTQEEPPSAAPSELSDTKEVEIAELPANSEEALWELDDAQAQVTSPDDEDAPLVQSKHQFEDLKSFLVQYPPPPYPPATKLCLPVILPQRRPKKRERGFIRAYALALQDCGISQDMFLDFLQTFYLSSQASPWIAAINLAGLGLSFVPHMSMLVGLAIQAGVMVAEDVQSRARTNSFLDKANAEVFRPRGLFCLVMTFDPSAAADGKDLNSTIANRLQPSGLDKIGHRFKDSSATTVSEMDFPESAPLIFPALDDVDDQSQDGGAASTKEKLSRKKKYVEDYFDKRARARFAGKNPDSVLAQGPQPTFTSRYADPNHAAASGSFRSLITGGAIKPPSMTPSRGGPGGFGGRLGQGRQGLGMQGLGMQGLGRQGLGFGGREGGLGCGGREGGLGLGGRDGGLREQLASRRGFFAEPMPAAPYGGAGSQDVQTSNPPAPHGRVGLLGLPTAGSLIKKAIKSVSACMSREGQG